MASLLLGHTVKFGSGEETLENLLKVTSTEEIFLTSSKSVIKHIPLYTTYSKELYQNETTALRILMTSPNIVELEDFCVVQTTPPSGFLKLKYYENQSLLSLLKSHSFTEQQVLQVARDLLLAVSKLEEAGILHRNISLENVLVDKDFKFALSGFGNSALIQDLKAGDWKLVLGNVEKSTHPLKRPPDFQFGLILEKIDIWALGCVLYSLISRTYPPNQSPLGLSQIQDPSLSSLISSCLTIDPYNRPTAISLLFQMMSQSEFKFLPVTSEISIPSSSCSNSCYCILDDSENPPDLYFLQELTSKSWMSTAKAEKILSILRAYDKSLTSCCIKVLLAIHRLMISGPESMLKCKEILDNILNLWQNKLKDSRDRYFSDYFCGLIRQFSRVLLDKLAIHAKVQGTGNWKQLIPIEHIDELLQYLLKVVKICEALTMSVSNLSQLNVFLKTQLLEECQRAITMANVVLTSNNRTSDLFSSILQRLQILTAPPPVVDESNSKRFHSHVEENQNSSPEFPKLTIIVEAKGNYLDSRWEIKTDDLEMGKVLAGGSSCTVYKGKFKCTPVAIKVMRGTFMGKSLETEFEREVTAMVTLRHPNLVLFMGACKSPQMIIVSEFCAGGSLFTFLHESKNIMISWKQKLKILKDVARGMLYLHEAPSPILHRDLKSLNLLLVKPVTGPNENIFIKITDFGVARILDAEIGLTGQMGTLHWMAPEVISNQPYSLEADIYSYGICMWEVIAREVPYNGTNAMTIPVRVIKGERPNLSQIPSTCPDSLKHLVRMCWDPVPAKRPNFNQILDVLESLESDI